MNILALFAGLFRDARAGLERAQLPGSSVNLGALGFLLTRDARKVCQALSLVVSCDALESC